MFNAPKMLQSPQEYLGVAQDLVALGISRQRPETYTERTATNLDLLLVVVVGDESTGQFLAALSRVDGALVGSRGDVQRGSISLTATLDGSGVESLDVQSATHVNPFETAHVTNKDLVGVEL